MNTAQAQPPVPARQRELFLAALGMSQPAERAAFLDRECGADHALRQRIEDLLREHDTVGSFLETPAVSSPAMGPGGTQVIADVTEKPGDRVGRYKLLQKIGEGGCGVVYMAEQEEPVRRRVALKVIKLGMDTRSVIARFEAERQALALMDHPNIARVLDAGATETGRPYFVMELVRGIRITQYCDENHLPTNERLELFIQVCHAIQHAHQKGIIHRDIKPSNILVTLHDGHPVPKVIDFGIAKATEQRLTEKTLFTEFAAFIGTPVYMSPEQAEMSGLDIDTRSDIYSLGVLLYELLTGKTPFDAEELLSGGIDGCRRTIREQEPQRPSTRVATLLGADLSTTASQRRIEAPKLVHLLRGDLDWIVMKCLEKDRTRRYATASDVAADVQRYLHGDLVTARPPSNIYRLQKLVRRHRGAFSAAAAIAASLLVGIAVSTWLALRATRAEQSAQSHGNQERELRLVAEQQRARAEQEQASARLNEYVADINLAQQSLAAGNIGRAVQLLNKHRPQAGHADLRGFEWRYLWQLCQGDEHDSFPSQESPVRSLALSSDGELLAVGMESQVNVWNFRSKTLAKSFPKGASALAFLPDGKSLIASSGTTVRLWRLSDWNERVLVTERSPSFGGGFRGGPGGGRLSFAVSADGTHLASAGKDGVSLWNTKDWQQVPLLPVGASGPLAFSPDGKRLITETGNGLALWTIDGSRSEVVLEDSTNLFGFWGMPDRLLTFSPEGNFVVAARNILSPKGVFVVSIWDAFTGRHLATMPENPEHIEHTGYISSLAFSPDGRTLVTGSFDYSIRLWDFASRQHLTTLHGHLQEVWAITFSADGRNLVSAGKDGSMKLWRLPRELKDDVLIGPWHPIGFSKDGQQLAAVAPEGKLAFLDLASGATNQQFHFERMRGRGPAPIKVSGDLTTFAQALDDGTVRFRNTETGETNSLKFSPSRVDLIALSADANILITGTGGSGSGPADRGGRSRENLLRWHDLKSGKSGILTTNAFRALFAPDGRTLATFYWDGAVQIWDVETFTLRSIVSGDGQSGFRFPPPAALSPDGRILAVATGQLDIDNAIHLWDTTTAQRIGACFGHKQPIIAVTFSPDGRTLASTSSDSTLKLWNLAARQELLTIRRLGTPTEGLIFSPDGQMLAAATMRFSQSPGIWFYRAPLAD